MNFKILVLLTAFWVTTTTLAQGINISEGSGSFDIQGSGLHQGDVITVFYHKPANFSRNSQVLLVIPGAGRNGDDYRDSWVEASEKYNVLILAPSYPEAAYNYGDYHLGGVVKNLNLSKGVSFKQGTNQVLVDEDVVAFHVNPNRADWIFNDFDRIFELAKDATDSKQKGYDVFGHSAGGQILHRFAIFQPRSRARRILASNAGTYTLPNYETDFPFGMKNVGIPQKQLKRSFQKDLVLFLGELDNDSETRGRMLRSKTADVQGTNRLARGRHFFKESRKVAETNRLKFHWKLEVVPKVGHDQKKMATAAADYLYGGK